MRGKQTVRDMVLSMLVIGLGAGFLYLFIPHDDSLDPVRPIDYDTALVTAQRAAPYPVAAPVGLPEQWRPTSVRYRGESEYGAAWHLGFVDPDNEYAAVEQSDGSPAQFIEKVTRGADRTDRTQTVDGERWVRYEGEKYDALVREEPGVTTVVTGTAPFGRLAQLAAALEADENEAGENEAGENEG